MIEKIYDKAPAWAQNLAISLRGWLIQNRRYGPQFHEELKRFEQYAYKPDVLLRDMLVASCEVPAYKGIVNDTDLDALRSNPLVAYDILKKFPVVGKQQVKDHLSDYKNPNYPEKVFTMKTSGTTGSGLLFPYSVEMENKQWAVWWRYRRALGIQLDTWCGWLGGRSIIPLTNRKPPYWRVNRPGRQVMYSSHHLSSATVMAYHDDMEKRKLQWLHGYPSSASLLASLIVESGLNPIESVRWVTTGAENLLKHQVETIKRAFPNALVRTHYGLAEGVANFSQDKNGEWHIDDDFAYVEFLPLDGTGESVCRIVGTGLSNRAFPLIRYDTGDLAKVHWIDGKPEFVEIYGRQEDYIELPNGVKLGRLDHIFKDSVNIREAQIHQIKKNLIELRVVKDGGYTDQDERHLLYEASSRFGKEVELMITYCDRIERTKAGKVRFVVTDI